MRIAGEKVGAGRSGERAIDVFNPFTRKRIGSVPKATVEEVRQAFRIARAYRATLSRYERASILDKTAALVRERTAEIAGLISAESGLCLKDATYEAGRVADVLSFGANECLKDDGQIFSLRPHAARQAAPRLHAARAAARRHQRDHAVQPPDEPGRAQGRSLDRDQQPDGAQALREGAAVGALLRRPALRGRAAARDALGRHRRPARDRRRARHQRRRRPRHLHRRRRDRQGDRRQGGLPAHRPRARRQRPDHRHGRRRPRRGVDARGPGLVQELGPALHRGQADARAPGGRRRLHRARRRQDESVAPRRPGRRERRHGHRHRRGGGAPVRGARRRGGRAGRAPARRQPARRRALFADRPRPRPARDDAGARGDLRSGLADPHLRRHRRGDPHLERHRLRPVVVGVHQPARPHRPLRRRARRRHASTFARCRATGSS